MTSPTTNLGFLGYSPKANTRRAGNGATGAWDESAGARGRSGPGGAFEREGTNVGYDSALGARGNSTTHAGDQHLSPSVAVPA